MPVFYSNYVDIILCMLSCLLLFSGITSLGIAKDASLDRPPHSWRYVGVALIVLAIREWLGIYRVSQSASASFFPPGVVLHTAAGLLLLVAAGKEAGRGSFLTRNVNIVLAAACILMLGWALEPYVLHRQFLAEQKSPVNTALFFLSRSAPFFISLVFLSNTLKKHRRPPGLIIAVLVTLCLHCLLIAVSHPPGVPARPDAGSALFHHVNIVLLLLRAATALLLGVFLWLVRTRELGVANQLRWWPMSLLAIFLIVAVTLCVNITRNHDRAVRANLAYSAVAAASVIDPDALRKAAETRSGDGGDTVFDKAREAGFFQGYTPLRHVIDVLALPEDDGPGVPVLDAAADAAGGRWNPADASLRDKLLSARDGPVVQTGGFDTMSPMIVAAPVLDKNRRRAGVAVMSVSAIDLAREAFVYKRSLLMVIPPAFFIFLLLFSGLQHAWIASHHSSRSEAIRIGALGNNLTGVMITRGSLAVDCNQRLLDILDMERDGVIGVSSFNAFDVVNSGNQDRWQAFFRGEIASEGESFETSVRRRDGSIGHLLVYVRPAAGEKPDGGNYFIWESVDITSQKEMEKHLRHSRDMLQTTIDTLPIGVFLKDGAGTLLMVNKALAALLNIPPDVEMVGKKVAELMPEFADKDRRHDQIAIAKKGEPHLYEYHASVNGEERYFEVSKTAAFAGDRPNEQLIVGSLHDFTARQRAEDATNAERYFLLQLINALPLSMCYTDVNHVIRVCDRDFADEAGVDVPAALAGVPYETIAPYGPVETAEDDMVMATGVSSDRQFELKKDGRSRNFIIRRTAMRDRDGKTLGLLKAFSDTTALVSANRAAKKADRAKAAFLANMSHELRTPMNGIIGMSDLIIEDESTKPLQRLYAETVIKSAKTLQMVMDEVMDVATLDDAREQIGFSVAPFPLLPLAEEAAQIVTCIAESWDARIFFSYDYRLRKTYNADARHIRQIIVQILTHCSRITADKRLHFAVGKTDDDRVSLRVSFTKAPDVSAAEIEAMFKRPSRDPKTDSQFVIGMFNDRIGLPLAWRLIDSMQGELVVSSSESLVTCETILPLEPSADGGPPTAPASLKGLPVLVATDSEAIAATALACLEHAGCLTARVSSPDDIGPRLADIAAGSSLPPVLLLDSAIVPEKERPRFLAGLKKLPQSPDLDVFMLISSKEVQNMQNLPDNVRSLALHPLCPSDVWYKLDAILRSRDNAGRAIVNQPSQRMTRLIRIPARILLVEDNTVNQMVALGLLKRIGCQPSLAKNGKEALDLIVAGNKYDLILMDCMMPVMDGYVATARIREHEKNTPGTRRNTIVALTANNVAGDRERCLAAGMDGYIAKPVTLDVLRNSISRIRPELVTYIDGLS